MQFIWDPNKERANRRDHGIGFETAMRAFADPHHWTELDRIEDGDERWHIVGLVDAMTLLLVVFTTWDEDDGEEVVRIISARNATPHERRNYENDKTVH